MKGSDRFYELPMGKMWSVTICYEVIESAQENIKSFVLRKIDSEMHKGIF